MNKKLTLHNHISEHWRAISLLTFLLIFMLTVPLTLYAQSSRSGSTRPAFEELFCDDSYRSECAMHFDGLPEPLDCKKICYDSNRGRLRELVGNPKKATIEEIRAIILMINNLGSVLERGNEGSAFERVSCAPPKNQSRVCEEDTQCVATWRDETEFDFSSTPPSERTSDQQNQMDLGALSDVLSNCVRPFHVSRPDGPTPDELDEIIEKFKEGFREGKLGWFNIDPPWCVLKHFMERLEDRKICTRCECGVRFSVAPCSSETKECDGNSKHVADEEGNNHNSESKDFSESTEQQTK